MRIRQHSQLVHKMMKETRIISTSCIISHCKCVIKYEAISKCQYNRVDNPGKGEVQRSQTCLSTLLFLSQKNKILRRDKFLEQMEIYPNENQMINAKRIFFLWIYFSSLI